MCSCHSAVLVPVGALAPWCSSGPCARVMVRCSYPSVLLLVATRPAAVLLLVRYSSSAVLLLVRYSSGGRAATRPLLVQRPCCYSSATRPRPCCYSSATRPAAVLLLVRYSSGGRAATRPLLVRRPCCYSSATRPAAVLLLVRYSSGGRAATRPLRRRPCCYSSATRPRPCCYSSATRPVVVQKNSRLFFKAKGFARYTHAPRWNFLSGKPLADPHGPAVVHWWKPKGRYAHFQRKSGRSGLLVVVVVLLLLLRGLASVNRIGGRVEVAVLVVELLGREREGVRILRDDDHRLEHERAEASTRR